MDEVPFHVGAQKGQTKCVRRGPEVSLVLVGRDSTEVPPKI